MFNDASTLVGVKDVKLYISERGDYGDLTACLQILARECSYSQTLDGSLVLRKVVLFTKAHRFGKDSHRVLREERDTHLATQLSQS